MFQKDLFHVVSVINLLRSDDSIVKFYMVISKFLKGSSKNDVTGYVKSFVLTVIKPL